MVTIRKEISNFFKNESEGNSERNKIYKWIASNIPKKIKKDIIYLRNKHEFRKVMKQYNENVFATTNSIGIEFASFCNLRCKWCSLDHNKPKEILTEEILERLLKDLVYDKRFKFVKRLNLWNGGETLLNPNTINLLKLIKRYKKLGIKKNGSFPKVILKTNGMLLTKDISSKIVELNAVDKMSFSVDGGTKEKYEEIRRLAKWDIVIKNISDFQEVNNNKIPIEIGCIVDIDKKLNMSWMSKDFQELLKKSDEVSIIHPMNWDGSVELNVKEEGLMNGGCLYLMRQLILLPNGDVTVCCRDLNSRSVVGNILKNSLFEIYNCNKRRGMIKLISTGHRDKIELCKNCTNNL